MTFYHIVCCLSTTFLFYFSLSFSLFLRQLCKFITIIFDCQELFLFLFFVTFSVASNFDILSQSLLFVNNFFYFFKVLRFGTLQFNAVLKTTFVKYHKLCCLSRNFYKFLRKSGEGGIWTLAPVSRPIPLAGAPLRPLEYFSKGIS